MEKLLFLVVFIFLNKLINCYNNSCFEFSCEECETQEIGKCTKCRKGFRLVDGTCPCSAPNCALCSTGLSGFRLCALCKNGYYNEDNECKCEINDCELCTENNCIMCKAGYAYNEIEKKCEKQNETNRIHCFDENCDSCYNTVSGSCKICKKGYFNKKGECEKLPSINEKNECPTGYYLDNKSKICKKICGGVSCTIKKSNYYKCDSNDCLICQNNILMIYDQCDDSANCKIEGCLNCITEDECFVCTQGYYLLGGICHKCPYGCSICTNNEACITCLSGFELNSSQECISSKNLDFNINKYEIYKDILLKVLYAFDRIIDLGDINAAECDLNCKKCYQNTGKCIECQTKYKLRDNKCIKYCSDDINCQKCYQNTNKCIECEPNYRLQDDKCIKYCSDPNCLQCPVIQGYEKCKECVKGCIIKEGKCVCDCKIPGCLDCTLKNGEKICKKCALNFVLNKGSCKKKINITNIVYSIFGIIISILAIVFCCIKMRRNERRNIPIFLGRNIIVNENRANNEIAESEMREIRKEVFFEEFEILKRKHEKANQICQFCKKKEGKYKCDCGCIVCKEHSNLNKKEGDIQNNKVCLVCKKIVKNVSPIKYECNICFQNKLNVTHFKCGCSLNVCKACYIKCRMMSNKCPGCRAIL